MKACYKRSILLVCGMLPTFCLGIVTHSPAYALDAEKTGLQIAIDARERQKGFVNFTANLAMILRNKQGKESGRELQIKVMEVPDDGDRTVFAFSNPRDVKGTGFLVHAHKTEPDDQWLYLPALKRVKRISASKQSGSFMGSEFSYEDLGAAEVEKYTHKLLRSEQCGELECYVLERIPLGKDSGYSRQLVWIDHDELRTVQVQFFDRRNAHLKTMILDDFRMYLGDQWRAHSAKMTNHITGKSTDLNWSDFEFKTDLSEKDFTQTALKRLR